MTDTDWALVAVAFVVCVFSARAAADWAGEWCSRPPDDGDDGDDDEEGR